MLGSERERASAWRDPRSEQRRTTRPRRSATGTRRKAAGPLIVTSARFEFPRRGCSNEQNSGARGPGDGTADEQTTTATTLRAAGSRPGAGGYPAVPRRHTGGSNRRWVRLGSQLPYATLPAGGDKWREERGEAIRRRGHV